MYRCGRMLFCDNLNDRGLVWTCTVTLFSDFCVILLWGKNNGGRASFQTKRAQQVLCMSIIVVYIVLCSEIHNCTWKIASLERSSDQDSSRSIRGALQACFGFHEFFTIVQGKLVCFNFLDHISKPNFVRERNDFARVTDWCSDVDRSRSSEQVKEKKVRSRPANRWPAPRPRVSSPPFSTAKNRHKKQ